MLCSKIRPVFRRTSANAREIRLLACEKTLPDKQNSGYNYKSFQEADVVDVYIATASGCEGWLARRNNSVRRNYLLYNPKDRKDSPLRAAAQQWTPF